MKQNIKVQDLSPLRYPGSKKYLVPYLVEIIKYNNLCPDVLIEPFVGGGNISMHFLIHNIVKSVIISDKDKLIYSFWKVLFTNPNYLVDFINKTEINLENFYKYKKIAKSNRRHKIEVLAEACIFLNRTSFSGLLTDRVGPLGGKSQTSKYKIDCRFNRKNLVEKIRKLTEFSENVTVLNHDWQDTIDYVTKLINVENKIEKPLFYIDPPFYKKADELYRFYFEQDEHESLCASILNLNYSWVLSYDNADEIIKMYKEQKCENINIEMPYSVNSNATRFEKELIITPLSLPKFD